MFKNNTIVEEAFPFSQSWGEFDDIDAKWVYDKINELGQPSALFHSHPCVAVPSSKDLMFMKTTIPFWKCVWLIMSNNMKLRAWTIGGNRYTIPQRGETIRAVEIMVEIYE